jgi:hypothetical protein
MEWRSQQLSLGLLAICDGLGWLLTKTAGYNVVKMEQAGRSAESMVVVACVLMLLLELE